MNEQKLNQARQHLHDAVDCLFDALFPSVEESSEQERVVNSPASRPVVEDVPETPAPVEEPYADDIPAEIAAESDEGEDTTDAPDESAEDAPEVPDMDELRRLPYNEFKSRANKLGVSCTGTRAQIEARIVEKYGLTDAASAPAGEPAPVQQTEEPRRQLKRRSAPAKEPEPEKDEFDVQADKYVDYHGVAQVVDDLQEYGVTVENVRPKLAELLRLGVNEGGVSLTYSDKAECGIIPSYGVMSIMYDPRFDTTETGDPLTMTEKRREAFSKMIQAYHAKHDEGVDAFNGYLKDQFSDFFNEDEVINLKNVLCAICDEDELKEISVDENGDDIFTDAQGNDVPDVPEDYYRDALSLFYEVMKRTVDDEGVVYPFMSDETYRIGNDIMHCGHVIPLKGNKFVCPICGMQFAKK